MALGIIQSPAAPSRYPSGACTFVSVFLGLLREPSRILRLWNWKSAVLSAVLRGPIFLVATIRHGWQSVLAALFVESVYCAVTAGFYGAIVQAFRDAEPEWLTGLFITLALPITFQVLEFGLHWLRGTPHLRAAEIASIIVSALSALFNWYAMRRGTLLVAGEGSSMSTDLRSLPRLFLEFFILIPYRAIQRVLGVAPGFGTR